MKNKLFINYRVIIFLLMLLISKNILATNYYVKNGGNDSYTGRSNAQAWATISKVNNSSFSAGDTIFFRRGDRWLEYLIVPSSGNKNSYITFTSYGTGAKPKLYGSKAVTSFTPHPNYSDVYRCDEFIDYDLYYGIQSSSARASLFFIIDDSVTWGDGRLDRETSLAALANNFKFVWQNDSVYFYYDGDISDIDTVEVPQLGRGIDVTQEYITIDGLDLRYFAGRCIGTSNYPEVTMHGFQLRNCILAYTASKEEAVGYGMQLAFCDMIIENNIAHDNGRRNLSLNLVANTGNAVMKNVIIQNNELYNGYHTTGTDITLHAVNQQIKNIIIRNNHIYDKYGGNGFESESIFLQNYEGVAPEENYDSIYIYNNVIQNTTLDGVYMEHQKHVYIINNTFTGGGPRHRAFIFNTTLGVGGKHTIMNNIFCNYPGSPMTSIDGATDGSLVLDTCDYNLYYSFANPNAVNIWYQMFSRNFTYNQFSDIQEAGYELNSPAPQAPRFIDSIYDLRLKLTSPAIRAGKQVSFVTTDFLGNERDPIHPTIGAYEFNPDSSAADILFFKLAEQFQNAIVDSAKRTVTIVVKYGTDIKSLSPEIVLSVGASVEPKSGVLRDFTEPQTYTVTSLDGTAIETWTVIVTISTTDIENPGDKMNDLFIYPNPSADFVYIRLDTDSEIRIIDLTGKIVHMKTYENGIIKINHNLQKGIYLLNVTNSFERKTSKLIIQ